MEQKINEINQQIANINQAIALARATIDNPFDAYLNKPAMIAEAKVKLTTAIDQLVIIKDSI